MIDPRALLPHESICRDCGGEKRVMREVETAIDCIAAEPKLEEVGCETCDGTGIEVHESRNANRAAGEIAAEFTRLRNQLALEHALVVELTATVRRLHEENKDHRRVITGWGRVLQAAR